MTRAFVFPGQGAQTIGMGKALAEAYPAAQAVFDEVDEALGEKLDGQQFIVIRQASDAGSLYGSVTTRDAAEVATAEGFSVDRKQVVITTPIKELGLHSVDVVLHPEVTVSIALNVARSEEEAELQASGKSIQELAAEEEAQAEFEIQELFDDIGAAQLDDDDAALAPAGDADEQPAS